MSTPLHPSSRRLADDDEDWQTPGQSARGRYKRVKRDSSLNRSVAQQRLILKTKMDQTPDTASPAPPGSGHPILNQFVTEPSLSHPPARRPRPLTQHQLAVEQNRRHRIEYLLAQRKNEAYRKIRAQRQNEIPFARYGRLLQSLPEGYDTEDEEHSWGKGGLIPNPEEEEDYGEAANYFLSVIRKAARRLDRWDWEDANGPKRDRKKEREERLKAFQNGLLLGSNLDLAAARAATSSRGRARPGRGRRKTIGTSASAASTPKRQNGLATPARGGRGGRGRGSRGGLAAASASASARDGLEPPSDHPDHDQLSPAPASEDVDVEGEGDETIDDIDKDMLGEGEVSGEEDDEAHAHRRPSSHARGAAADIHDEQGYDESYIGDGDGDAGEGDADVDEEDADALSSENEDEHDDEADEDEIDDGAEGDDIDVEAEGEGDGEGDDNSSAYEGGNGYAGSEAEDTEPEADADEGDVEGDVEEPEAEGEGEGDGDEDEVMEDQ